MFKPIYTSTGAMLGFSSMLDVISNNVSNMNTPGFKRSEVAFKDVFYNAGFAGHGYSGQRSIWVGSGNDVGSGQRVFTNGEMSPTGRDLDAAISGNGFFVLRKNGELFYTRAGQFELSDEGYLIDSTTGGRVMAYNGSALDDISIAGLRTSAPKATSRIAFEDNLSSSPSNTTPRTVTVQIHDPVGDLHTLNITFTKNPMAMGGWLVEVADSNGQPVGGGPFEIRFRPDGTPEAGFNSFDVNMRFGTAPPMTVTFFFGEPGSMLGATSYATGSTSTLRVAQVDGHALGSLSETTFDASGKLTLTYSNGQTVTGPQLALADFFDRQSLQPVGDNLFRAPANLSPRFAIASSGGMGSVVAKNIELSNVDLTAEFSDIIINQRGFQASSQLMNVANQLLDTLIADTSGGR
ncbi:MAG TPA: flagellar basal-body rod protein FlgF [Gammaproteobacteria bacterium]|nr:flagellar basal-body rod protein FlgF [Gammaproteobacteria bacterium]